ADNADGSAGDVRVSVRTRGRVQLPISAIGITANDRPAVYASDDNAFTLTASTNTLIGYVSRWVSTGVAIVEFDALAVKAALQA
ncbi:MAG: cytoplasmic protein, partial [Pseudomonadota bacterium]|nr:cytoplasmic protein [Pseudomonadota bacterium]